MITRTEAKAFILTAVLGMLLVFAVTGCGEDAPPTPTGTDGGIAIVTLYTRDGLVLRRYHANVSQNTVDFSSTNLCMFNNADTGQDVTVNTDNCTVVVDYLPPGVNAEL